MRARVAQANALMLNHACPGLFREWHVGMWTPLRLSKTVPAPSSSPRRAARVYSSEHHDTRSRSAFGPD
jgi:hypothetical protein